MSLYLLQLSPAITMSFDPSFSVCFKLGVGTYVYTYVQAYGSSVLIDCLFCSISDLVSLCIHCLGTTSLHTDQLPCQHLYWDISVSVSGDLLVPGGLAAILPADIQDTLWWHDVISAHACCHSGQLSYLGSWDVVHRMAWLSDQDLASI